MNKKEMLSAKTLTRVALLLALIIVLQVFASAIKIGTTPLSFVLVPIVLGGMLFGAGVAAFLGFAFGVVVLLGGILGTDPFTAILFKDHPVLTSLLCLGKGTACGAASAWVFAFMKKKAPKTGVFLASATAPIVNTGVFIGMALLMSGTLKANFVADGTSVIYFLVIVCAGVNFLVELAINMVCASGLYTLISAIDKSLKGPAGGRK